MLDGFLSGQAAMRDSGVVAIAEAAALEVSLAVVAVVILGTDAALCCLLRALGGMSISIAFETLL